MPSRQHSLTRRTSGFIPLDGGPGGYNMADNGIPLTQIKSNRSNISTGNRKPTQVHASSFSSHTENEKPTGILHHRRGGGRARRSDDAIGRKDDDEGGHMNAMGKLYAKIVAFSPAARHIFYIAPVALLLAVPLVVLPITGHRTDITAGSHTTVLSNKTKKVTPGPALFDVFLWIEISWLCIWAAKLAAWLLPQLFIFFCGFVSVGTRKYGTVLDNIRLPFTLFFWALASWLSFKGLFNNAYNDDINWVQIMWKIFGAVFISSIVLLIEQALVQLIGVSYHQRSFANRIKASKHEIWLLGLLYDASRTLFPMHCPEFEEEDIIIEDGLELKLGHKKKRSRGHKSTGSATPMRLIGEAGRVGGKFTNAVGNIASEIAGKEIINTNSAHSVVVGALEKLRPSEALARRIWLSFVLEGHDNLYLEDFQEVLGSSHRNEAEEAFFAIDSDMNGDVSLDEMVRKVVEIGKERKAISEGMKDIGQALRAFDKVLLFIVLLIVIFIFLAWFQSSFLTVVASAGTALLSLSFVFAVTTQEFLGSCIFLFVKHPYDVGDRVVINNIQMVVDRISLLYSVFTRSDTMQVSQVPNIQLNNLWVDNISRSKAMQESVEVDVSYDTSFEDIELLRAELEKFVRSPDNSRDFKPDFNISVGGVGNLDKMMLLFSIKHKSNWHDDAVRATRRSKFMCALAVALKKIPMIAPGGGGDALGGPDNPTYSVSVTDDDAVTRRTKSSQAKDAARMVPTQTEASAEETKEAEEKAIAEINAPPTIMETAESWGAMRPDINMSPDEVAMDKQRNHDLEAIRDDLKKTASQRGRRKAGEGLHTVASRESGSNPDSSMYRSSSQRMPPFDEEAVTGMPSNFYELNRPAPTAYGASQQLQPQPQVQLQPVASFASQRSMGSGSQGGSQGPPPPPPAAGQR